jgi:hypothetical protein
MKHQSGDKPCPCRQVCQRVDKLPMPKFSFQSRWLERFELPESGWIEGLDGRLAKLPFCDLKDAKALLRFLFDKLPGILEKDATPDTHLLAEAFAWTCFAFWQCGSAFPSFPENYATCLHQALKQSAKKRSPLAMVLARLIVPANGAADGRCGFNQLALNQPELIRGSESLIHDGRYEDYLKAKEKYDEFEDALKRSKEFKADWQQIKVSFPKQVSGKGMIHRTLIPERNWERGPGAEFGDVTKCFQAVFDLFCWKYYLWAMDGDQPHLLKASVVFTPLGTQIFIPGYLSFDSKRDLDYRKIAKLHKARGVTRQGPGFSEGRKVTAKMKAMAKKADQEAREKGLKGDKRYAFICKQLKMLDHGDNRQVKRLLE